MPIVTRYRKRKYRLRVLAVSKFYHPEIVTILISVFTRRRTLKDFASAIYIPFKRYPRWNERRAERKASGKEQGRKSPPSECRMAVRVERHKHIHTFTLSLVKYHAEDLSIRTFEDKTERRPLTMDIASRSGAGYAMGNVIVSSSKGRWTQDTKNTGKIWDGGRSKRIGIMIKFSTTRGTANIIRESR